MNYKGRDYLICVNVVTSYVWISRLKSNGAKEISDAVKHFVRMWGALSLLKTERATGFTANAFGDFCEWFQIYHKLTSAYNPKSNGSSKQIVLEVKNLMKKVGILTLTC